MTKKLNLSPLIKYFSDKNPTISGRLYSLTEQGQASFRKESQNHLKKLNKIAQALMEAGDKLDRTNPKLAAEADQLLQEVVREAQSTYTDKLKRVKETGGFGGSTALTDAAKGVGDWFKKQFDGGGTADHFNRSIQQRQQGQQDSGQKMMDEQMGGDKCMSPGGGEEEPVMLIIEQAPGDKMMGDGEKLLDKSLMGGDEAEVLKVEDITEPAIDEIAEPDPEYDETDLEDIKDQLSKMKWRIADKKRREALEEAIEHVQKAMDYHNASKTRRDKVHDIFDGAGLQLRLKDFD